MSLSNKQPGILMEEDCMVSFPLRSTEVCTGKSTPRLVTNVCLNSPSKELEMSTLGWWLNFNCTETISITVCLESSPKKG